MPVSVSVNVPLPVLEPVWTVRVEVWFGFAIGFGENEVLDLLGLPLTLSVTEPVKPFGRVIVTV